MSKKKEEEIRSENVGQYLNINTKTEANSYNNYIISQITLNSLKNVGQFLDIINSERGRPYTIYIRPSVIYFGKQALVLKSIREGVMPQSLNKFIEQFLIELICSEIKFLKNEEKQEEKTQIKCFICGKTAVCFLKHFHSLKPYPVCEVHKKECLERGWLPVEENAGG